MFEESKESNEDEKECPHVKYSQLK